MFNKPMNSETRDTGKHWLTSNCISIGTQFNINMPWKITSTTLFHLISHSFLEPQWKGNFYYCSIHLSTHKINTERYKTFTDLLVNWMLSIYRGKADLFRKITLTLFNAWPTWGSPLAYGGPSWRQNSCFVFLCLCHEYSSEKPHFYRNT